MWNGFAKTKKFSFAFAEGEDERLCDCPLDSFRCQTGGGCIPLKYVCDGSPQCPDFSDEWKCFTVTESPNSGDEPNESKMPALLTIKKSTGQYQMVCAAQWHQNYSNNVCAKLGYGSAERWSPIQLNESQPNATFFRLRDALGGNILTNLYEVDHCEDGVVSLQCADFECGKDFELDNVNGQTPNSTNVQSLAVAVSDTVRCTATIGKCWIGKLIFGSFCVERGRGSQKFRKIA